jgi:8-oxo-dGTP diphosphatase
MSGRMVVGFMFAEGHVLLQCKKKPDWMRGLWNGIGGKVDFAESARDAMVREGREETGHTILGWEQFCIETGEGYNLHCYKRRLESMVSVPPENDAGEPQCWVDLTQVGGFSVVGNLRWLLPLAMDWRRMLPVVVNTQQHIRERPTWRMWG